MFFARTHLVALVALALPAVAAVCTHDDEPHDTAAPAEPHHGSVPVRGNRPGYRQAPQGTGSAAVAAPPVDASAAAP